jgi:quercetin dioxygenase-like cupin family protein
VNVTNWDQLEEHRISENVSRKLFWGSNLMVRKMILAPNTYLPIHDHAYEQLILVENGELIIMFSDGVDHWLKAGEFLLVPIAKSHGTQAGPDGCVLLDIASPVSKDLVDGESTYLESSTEQTKDPYLQLYGYLRANGIKTTLDELKTIPIELLARYTYERGCITMGELRKVLDIDKKQAKSLLREWKHGDDHSESSYKRKFERLVIIPQNVIEAAKKLQQD